jgi:biotin operon repressor
MSRKRILTSETISAFLKLAPRSNEELRTLTGLSRSCVSKYLEQMESDGLVHRRRKEIHRGSGYQYMWHDGPVKVGSTYKVDSAECRIPGAMPKQRIVRQFTPINRRDDLVAALFGPAPKVAA